MEACLYASTPSLASNIRRVLGGFHSQKKQRGVDELLLRLYEPLLFRALQVNSLLEDWPRDSGPPGLLQFRRF
jgi:hypothetical protein